MNPQFLKSRARTGTEKSLFKSASRRKGNRVFFAPLVFCGLWSGISAGTARAQSAEQLLILVRQGESKIQLRATQTVQRGASREVATLYRSGIKRRLEWSAPSVRAGDILVDDGRTVTLFHRADGSATQTHSTRRVPALAGSWKVGAPVRFDGRTARVLSRGGVKNRELTVDAKTGVILRSQGPLGVTSLQNLQFGAVPASKFALNLPSNVQIVRSEGRLFGDLNAARRTASWLQGAPQLPGGYNFESAIAGKNEVWLRYSNGQKRFSIFQQKTGDADLPPQDVNGSWFWRKNGVRFVATGAPKTAIAALAP